MFKIFKRKAIPEKKIVISNSETSIELPNGEYSFLRGQLDIYNTPITQIRGKTSEGREISNPINASPASNSVSREHALLKVGEEVSIRDNQSTNGTYLNNKRLNPHQEYKVLQGEHNLKLGNLELKLKVL